MKRKLFPRHLHGYATTCGSSSKLAQPALRSKPPNASIFMARSRPAFEDWGGDSIP